MNIKDKIESDMEFSVHDDQGFFQKMVKCWDLCFEYNNLKPSMMAERHILMRKIIGKTTENFLINSPFYCSLGTNIEIGENACFSQGCTIMDGAKVTFGDYVWMGPSCGFYSSGHSMEPEKRQAGYAHPITVGNNVGFGGGVIVACPEKKGITIGDNSVIGAGSVVTKDISPNVLAAGNPCKVIREVNTGAISL